MSSKPTLIFVPGAWHSPDTWNKVTAELEPQGYKSICISLPTTLSDPTKGLFDDINETRKYILAETSQGRDVVVVVHSYGGMVGPSAIKGLTEATSERPGRVIGIALMATGYCATGVGFLEGIGGSPPPFWKADTETGYATLIVDTRELFYHDLPEEEGNYWVSRLLKHALKPLTDSGEHVYSGWKDVPTRYLVTTDDKTFPLEVQLAIGQGAKEQGADVVIERINTSHSPMLSKPKETADFIARAAESFAK
jgi:pimeloyl-ACP methyl ester carboxylesterase